MRRYIGYEATGSISGIFDYNEMDYRIRTNQFNYAASAAGLYAFTTFTFTNGGQTGATGPSLSTLLSSYNTVSNPWLSNTTYFSASAGIQLWTVPETATYSIDTYGAAGGGSGFGNFGTGARIKGDFSLTQGTRIFILSGQRGIDSNASGGGGGSFVSQGSTNFANSTLLIAAGGGGGYGNSAGNAVNAVTTINGAAGLGAGYAGGTNGNGGVAGTNTGWGGAGAGWLGDGGDGGVYGGIAPRVQTNGQGSTGPFNCAGVQGGFGGGGGGGCNGAGGGGGYSGGGTSGGGGGSFAGGTNQINTANANTGHGYVVITKL